MKKGQRLSSIFWWIWREEGGQCLSQALSTLLKTVEESDPLTPLLVINGNRELIITKVLCFSSFSSSERRVHSQLGLKLELLTFLVTHTYPDLM